MYQLLIIFIYSNLHYHPLATPIYILIKVI